MPGLEGNGVYEKHDRRHDGSTYMIAFCFLYLLLLLTASVALGVVVPVTGRARDCSPMTLTHTEKVELEASLQSH